MTQGQPHEEPALDPYVRFWIENGVEVAMLTAASFRAAMTERDRLRTALGLANFDKLANAEKVERLRAEVLAVINSFDNRDFSATPDQRDVIDPIRRVLGRHRHG